MTVTAHTVSRSDFWALLWGQDDGQRQITGRYDGRPFETWIPCPSRRRFERILDVDDCYVSPVCRRSESAYDLGPAWVLWARLERPDCQRRLASRLPATPTLVLREGGSSRRWVLWGLTEPLCGDTITRANERLAHRLGGRRGAADASGLIVSPFTHLTRDRQRPVEVEVEYRSDATATAAQIVGALPDAPPTDGWKRAA